jgi:predicted flap endonuclease-1-like 5' DNA nuclease
VKAIRVPAPQAFDIAPLLARLADLERSVKAIQVPAAKDVDLSGVLARLGGVEAALRAVQPSTPVAPLDLGPTLERLGALERAVRAIQIPPATTLNLQPVLDKLAALEAARPPAPAPARALTALSARPSPAAKPIVRAGSRNLLARAAFGKPDDLKEIKGVATVLEKMLHKIGVFYFWQVAEWTGADVAHADTQLTAFKGRIARDGWVAQARVFARAPTAARKPAEL